MSGSKKEKIFHKHPSIRRGQMVFLHYCLSCAYRSVSDHSPYGEIFRQFLVHIPPIVEEPAIVVPFRRYSPTAAGTTTGFPLDPPLAIAVLGVLDVVTGMPLHLVIKPPIDIPAVRRVSPVIQDSQQPVISLPPPDSLQSAAGFSFLVFFRRIIFQKRGDLFVYFDFCHKPSCGNRQTPPSSLLFAVWTFISRTKP